MRVLELTDAEARQVRRAAVTATGTAEQLPPRLREHLARLVPSRAGVTLVSGLQVVDDDLGPTPEHWSQVRSFTPYDAMAALISAALGTAFGWPDEQNGRLVQDIVAHRTHAHEQVSSGSAETIRWHTEDAYQTHPPAFIGLLCLRNDERAETTFGPISGLQLTDRDLVALRTPCFGFRPDLSHVGRERQERRYPILTGPVEDITIRLDPYFMTAAPDGPHADAMARLCSQIEGRLDSVALSPGDLLVIDNLRAVHGRKPFHARYGTRGRWLKRTHVRD
ncbi:hypothetical protein [Longispora urticae]